MSGVEAVRVIRADPEVSDLPVVACTAKAMKEEKEEILTSGFDDYITKPIEMKELERIVKKWLC